MLVSVPIAIGPILISGCSRAVTYIASIVNMKNKKVSPAVYAELQGCQPTFAAFERSFSMLTKLLRKDRHFFPENVGQYMYLCLHYNKL